MRVCSQLVINIIYFLLIFRIKFLALYYYVSEILAPHGNQSPRAHISWINYFDGTGYNV